MIMDSISVVIPCYNSENTIADVVDELEAILAGKVDHEIILVCDCLSEKLWEIIRSLSSKYEGYVNGIRFSKNFGQHAALMAGYRACTKDIVITMDDDGQSDPSGIFVLTEKLSEGYDVVYSLYPSKKESLFRRLGSAINRKMCETLIDLPKGIEPMSFYAAKKYIIDEVVRYEGSFPYIGGLICRATTNMCNVTIEHRERAFGKSNYTIRKLLRLWMNGFTAFSVKPLEIASVIGFISALAGFIYAVVIVVRKIVLPDVPLGWSTLTALFLIIGGLIMIMLGLIGEYIGRIYICISSSPQYVVRETCGSDRD